MVAIVVPMLWIGLYPETFLRRIEPSVMELLRRMEERSAVALVLPGERAEPLPAPVATAPDAGEEEAP